MLIIGPVKRCIPEVSDLQLTESMRQQADYQRFHSHTNQHIGVNRQSETSIIKMWLRAHDKWPEKI
jgi:hypothetical protein